MVITRDDVCGLIRTQVIPGILQQGEIPSTFTQLATKLPDMNSGKSYLNVADALPAAYWVSGDTGQKKTSKAAWDKVKIVPGELAVIIPISENVLDDTTDADLIAQITPQVRTAMGRAIDEAVFFGTNRPQEWQSDLMTLARNAGNNVAYSTSSDLYNVILGDGGLFSKVEQYGYDVSGVVSGTGMKGKLRGLRDSTGQPLFNPDMRTANQYLLAGVGMTFPTNGSWDNSAAQMFAGDFTKLVWALRKDVTVTIATEATIKTPDVEYDLFQQDMIAIRIVIRLGWAYPNYASAMNPDRTGVPFAYLEPATPVTTSALTYTVTDNAEEPAPVAGAKVNAGGSYRCTSPQGEC
jgi:HK97 family phage major capsid protein